MTAPTNADVLARTQVQAAQYRADSRYFSQAEMIHQTSEDRATVAAIIEERNALMADAEAFRWLETHVTLAHRPDADRPMVVIDTRFRDGDGDLCSLCVTQHDGIGAVPLSTMVRVMRDAENATRETMGGDQ